MHKPQPSNPGSLFSKTSIPIAAIALPLLMSSTAYGVDKVDRARPTIKVARDFGQSNIKTIRMPKKPSAELHPVERPIYDMICEKLEAAGYQLVLGATTKAKEAVDADAEIDVKCDRGTTEAEYAKKFGFEGGESENYSLAASFEITVKDGRKKKEVYSAECKMWHKFVGPKSVKQELFGGFIVSSLPIDHYGEGPRYLKKAALEMGPLLAQKVPRAASGAPAATAAAQGTGPAAQTPELVPGQPDEMCKISTRIPFRCPEGARMGRMVWSPDGKTILFSLFDRSKDDKYEAEGDTLFSLTVSSKQIAPWVCPKMNHPAYSPDGNCVAAFSNAKRILVLVDCRTHKEQQLFPHFAWCPSFTHDGKRVCFMSHKSGHPDVWVVNADGSNPTQVTDTEGWENYPAASPREDLVAYWSHETKGVHVQRLDGDRDVLVRAANVGGGCPQWSPDGEMISFSYYDNIHVMDKNGQKQLALTSGTRPTTGSHAWSPDGTQVIYYNKEQSEFQILFVDTKVLRKRLGIGAP